MKSTIWSPKLIDCSAISTNPPIVESMLYLVLANAVICCLYDNSLLSISAIIADSSLSLVSKFTGEPAIFEDTTGFFELTGCVLKYPIISKSLFIFFSCNNLLLIIEC